MKPTTKELQRFSDHYFYNWRPKVRYRRMKDLGSAVPASRNIWINPKQSISTFGCYELKFKTRLKLKGNERFYATLLHEIGHFKIKHMKCSKRNIIAYTKSINRIYDAELHEEHSLKGAKQALKNYLEEYLVEEWAIREFKKQFR